MPVRAPDGRELSLSPYMIGYADEVVRRYADEESIYTISRALLISHGSVARLLKYRGVAIRTRGFPRSCPQEDAALVAAWRVASDRPALAERLGYPSYAAARRAYYRAYHRHHRRIAHVRV